MQVCIRCFQSQALKDKIARLSRRSDRRCDKHPDTQSISIDDLAAIFHSILTHQYLSVDDQTQDAEKLDSIIEALSLPLDESMVLNIIERLRLATNQAYYFSGSLFVPFNLHFIHGVLWSQFCSAIKYQQRFFNPNAKQNLLTIFSDIQGQRDEHGKSAVYLISPGDQKDSFFRARILDGEALIMTHGEQVRFLSPPPEHKRKPGRLNPAGIPVFYGAFEEETCVAELRPPVGSTIAIGHFTLTKPICVLDTTVFSGAPKPINSFDENFMPRMAQYAFMKDFMDEIARPVLPSDELLNYIPTQAVAEFLNKEFRVMFGRTRKRIDAIIFRSAQNQVGTNIAILGDASAVATHTEPERGPIRLIDGSTRLIEVSEVKFRFHEIASACPD